MFFKTIAHGLTRNTKDTRGPTQIVTRIFQRAAYSELFQGGLYPDSRPRHNLRCELQIEYRLPHWRLGGSSLAVERLESIVKGADALRENKLAGANRALVEARKIAEEIGASRRIVQIVISLQAWLETAQDRTSNIQSNANDLIKEFSELIDTLESKVLQRNQSQSNRDTHLAVGRAGFRSLEQKPPRKRPISNVG